MAADIYVCPQGDDANSGREAKPVATIERARELVQSVAGDESVTVHIADGVYYLADTLVFTPEDSGCASAPVLYRAENEGGAVLSGGSKLDLNYRKTR